MALTEAPESVTAPIFWKVRLAMTVAERYVNDGAAMFLTQRPVRGTVTLANGYKRPAEYLAGRRGPLQYKTPAGNWRNASAEVEASFVQD
jgi:hypothetical protein